MSRNVVDAAIRLAYRHRRTVMIIASRSQVEWEKFGCGYVEGWSTEKFINYIRSRDPAGLIQICRDHGGPWQHPAETSGKFDEAQVMSRSLESLLHDIRHGADIIHIDTSREADGPASFEQAINRLVNLYGECEEFARMHSKRVQFEVGLEQQSDAVDDPKEFRTKLKHILEGLARESLRLPTFVVGQTGTKVVGTENRGQLVSDPSAVGAEINQLAQICWEHGLALKAHNADYLPSHAMSHLMINGVDAVNIAPEYGVAETRAFLALLEELELTRLRDEFLALAYDSGSWRKWFDGEDTTDLQRSIVAGHYVFATDTFRDIKRQADVACQGQVKTVDAVLGDALDNVMERHAAEVWNSMDKET
jgi:tagatose-1,6-bisphosphate aldolase non-catalytic subunit AgaZ/GatZ